MDGADFLQLDPGRVARGERADWLTACIREAILGRALAIGVRVPSTRVLAGELGFSRGTVTEAYRRLTEEGLIAGSAGAGTIVVAPPQHRARASEQVDEHAAGATAPPPGTPEVIDLASGVPDLSAFPRTAWLRAEREVLATATSRQLGYGLPEGAEELRSELSSWLMRSRGVVAPHDGIIVTAGVTGAMSLLAQVLRADGHATVAVEDPSAEGNRRILSYWMPHLTPVPVDDDGIDTRALAESNARAVVVTPAHQYPTGVVLSPERRRELVAWTRDGENRENLIVEDDYDAEYRYDRRPVRAVQPLAPEAVAYTASLSKTLAPALRLGWLVPPEHLHRRLVELRWATDLGAPALPQLTLAYLLRNGTLERHLRIMRTRHRGRRDAAISAIREWLPDLHVGGIAAGLHLVVRLPDGLDDEQVAADARSEGIIVQPLSRHYARSGAPGLIINYAGHHPARLQAAIQALARVVPKQSRAATEPIIRGGRAAAR